MEAIFLPCGAGGPQLKRNPLGSDDTMRPISLFHSGPLLATLVLLPSAALPFACRSHSAQLPSPCAANGTIYSSNDSTLGVHAPRPHQLIIPARPIRGSVTVRLLIDQRGGVVRDSTRILDSGGPEADQLVREAAEATAFTPARLDKCSVSFWFDLRITTL